MVRGTANKDLSQHWVQRNPNKLGPAEAWIGAYGVAVWVLINQLQLDNWKAQQVAEDYKLPLAAIEAAIAYYKRHKDIIDARITLDRSGASA